MQECLELIKRKDQNLNAKFGEIESLFKKVQGYMVVQDLLYKDFVKKEKEFGENKKRNETELREAQARLNEEELKVVKLEEALRVLQKGNPQAIEDRIIELTKQNSILDINLLRLTRKYQSLQEQEQLIRQAYHNYDADMAEKDRFVQWRINKLKDWKARAIQQLKFLFGKLRCAVP